MIKNHILYNDYSDWTFDVSRAEGSFIYESNGKKLIDFTSGWNVTNLGWNHPEIIDAVTAQARKNTYVPMWTADSIQNELATRLTKSLPKGLDVVGRATGGTEANEEAIKTARAYTGRKTIIGFRETYHGQSYATMTIGYPPEYVTAISPMVGGFVQMDFPKLFGAHKSEKELLRGFEAQLEAILKNKDVAGIVTEAGIITGWGSAHVAPRGYVRAVRALTKKYGTMLILDEVGTGFSRLGKLYAMELESVEPDIVTFAKGLSNGTAAIGAMVTRAEIAKKTLMNTNVTSTFGWTPIACAAALKTLQIHIREKLWEKVKIDGDYLISSLRRELKDVPSVEDIRGIGMEIGIQLSNATKRVPRVNQVVGEAREHGLHLVSDRYNTIQLMPPLVIERNILDDGLDILVNTIKRCSN